MTRHGLLAIIGTSVFVTPVGMASASPAPPIRPTVLVPEIKDLPGFKGAKRRVMSSTSAYAWAHNGQGTWTQDQVQANYLERFGFEEGVVEYFVFGKPDRRGIHPREGVAETVVLSSAENAQHTMAEALQESLKEVEPQGVFKQEDRALPGSLVVGNFVSARRWGDANVFFTRGRCFLIVADSIHVATRRSEVERAPLAAALTMYRRLARVCA